MIKLEMAFLWLIAVIAGFAFLVAWTIADFFITLFELPFDSWEIVKEKYQEEE